jgi:diguanylate cyclase
MVREAIRNSDVDPSMLSLEITESALMGDIETSARATRALRDLGVKLAVDDFGTGYSSLAHLKQLPLGLTSVAEGVETVEQWIALDELGCTVGQGFLWSPPIPASSFAPLITGLRRRTARTSARGSGVDDK